MLDPNTARFIFYLLPMYIANSSAMLLGGGHPLDFNAKYLDKQPLFGKGKTIRGTISGIIFGSIAGLLFASFFPNYTVFVTTSYLEFAVFSSIGAIIGDIAGSFIKRRMKVKSGAQAPFLDQLDFLIGGILFSLHLVLINLSEFAVLAGVTIIVHKFSNWIGFKLKIKKVPW
ncbi:MAG TPA: CDP-2,3-bis-(O-geranylgeranyl)-sn-glycerol synthase [archaeon]|nr:CDP-2,3-bis-(O-geranylgeranyl)-sn-glycerol synthase [archaeon]